MKNSEEDKIWKANGETRGAKVLGIYYPQFAKEKQKGENGNDFGAAISNDFGNNGDQITLPEQQEASTDEKASGNVEMEGAKRSS